MSIPRWGGNWGVPIPETPVQQLFAGKPLSEMLAAAAGDAADTLATWPPDGLLNTSEADINEQLIRMATVEAPSLARDKARLEPPREITVQHADLGLMKEGEVDFAESAHYWRQARGPHRLPHVAFTRYTLVVPVTGNPSVFSMRASTFSADGPLAVIDHGGRALRLRCDSPGNAAQARADFERTLDEIEQRLVWTLAGIERHNQQMAEQLPAAVAQRRAKLLKDRALQASIGYPIMKRPDADSHSVPVKRRKIPLDRPARHPGQSNAWVPEPAINEADYESVLAVLRNARNALERSPSMSAKLDEEEIRDFLLVMLNGQFEGKAAGEVFNGAGKTDILVRDSDRNVFIGECKIFDPKNKQSVEHVIASALDQLLGYLVWRDTKAALLLFIRDASVTAVVDKALAAIGSHPNHKRPGKISSEERHDFVLHTNGDANREIRLAFLPFLIAAKSA
jgi:hypothetical protein